MALIAAWGSVELTEHAVSTGLAERIFLAAAVALPAAALGAASIPVMLLTLLYVVPWVYRRAVHPELERGIAPWHVITIARSLNTEGISFDQSPTSRS